MLRPSGCACITSTRAPAARNARGASSDAAPFAQSTTRCTPASVRPSSAPSRCATYPSRSPRTGVAASADTGLSDAGCESCAPSSASIAASTSTSSLRPPGPSSFTPLSLHGLWLADTIAAGSPARCARNATAGVEATPSERTSRTRAGEARREVGLDARAGLAGVAPDEERLRAHHARGRRDPNATTNGEVRSASASPRTPSVPKRSTLAPATTASSTAAPCGPS